MLTKNQLQAKFPGFDWETYEYEICNLKNGRTYVLQLINKSTVWIWSIDGDIIGMVGTALTTTEAKSRLGE